MTFTGFAVKRSTPSESEEQLATVTMLDKVLAMLHQRAEVIVAEIYQGALDLDQHPISTTERLNDRVALDIEGRGSDFGAPCRPETILWALGDALPASAIESAMRNLDITPDCPEQLIENLAIFAYFCGIREVLVQRFGMEDDGVSNFDPRDATAGIVGKDAVPSLLRHEIKRQREVARDLARQIGGVA